MTDGNRIAITGARINLLGVLYSTIGIVLGAFGLVIATLASREAARAVRAMENLERGYLNVAVAGADAGKVRLDLVNIGRTPVWIESVSDGDLSLIHDRNTDGIHCLAAEQSHVVEVLPAAGPDPGIVNVRIGYSDVLGRSRTVDAVLKLHADVWRLMDLQQQ